MHQRIRGVALILSNPKGSILILQEFVDKPHFGKLAGMFSIPMETSHPGEADIEALRRLHKEELAGLPSPHLPGVHVGAYRIVPRVWVKLYAATADCSRTSIFSGNRHEVGNHAWLPVSEALKLRLRQGAREMIMDHVAGKRGVLRRACSAPREFAKL